MHAHNHIATAYPSNGTQMSLPKQKFSATNLVPGKSYRVINAFKDYDGATHSVGEHWRFVKKSFLPYEDGLTLFVEKDGQETSFRMQWRIESQGQIIENFSDFVTEI